MEKFSVLFNNLDSYKELDLFIKARPDIPIPEKNINLIDIEGMNGSLTEDLGTYKDIEIPIDFTIVNKLEFHDKLRYIKAWLLNISNNKLVFSDDTGFFYKVNYVKLDSSILRTYKIMGGFKATFVCKPFSFAFSGLNKATLTTSGTTIVNSGAEKCDPIITAYGTGVVNLFVNNREIILKNLVGNITLDSTLKEAYNSTYANLNDTINGNYPYLDIGKNIITWTGTITKVEIIPNWIFL